MSNFLKELTSSIENCCREDYDYDWADNTDEVSMVMDLIGSLGENARRMLEMGIVQDKLVELGFRINRNDYPYESWKDEYFVHFLPNVAQESPLPSRGGMNCDSFYRMHMAR